MLLQPASAHRTASMWPLSFTRYLGYSSRMAASTKDVNLDTRMTTKVKVPHLKQALRVPKGWTLVYGGFAARSAHNVDWPDLKADRTRVCSCGIKESLVIEHVQAADVHVQGITAGQELEMLLNALKQLGSQIQVAPFS